VVLSVLLIRISELKRKSEREGEGDSEKEKRKSRSRRVSAQKTKWAKMFSPLFFFFIKVNNLTSCCVLRI
jgi:hypothetical protein